MGKLFRKDEVRTEISPLSKAELTEFLGMALEIAPFHYPLFLLLARTGMRVGEAIALKWSDLDFEQRLITVRRNINKFGNADTPKTAKVRRVDMSRQLKDALLKLHRLRKVEKLKNGWDSLPEWVFINSVGNHLDKNNLRNRVFHKIRKEAKLRSFRIHDLRHTYASFLIQAGESLAYVRDQLGHHSIQVTVDIYGHLVPGGNKEAVDRLDDLDFNAPKRTLCAP
jgi:integrase